MTIKIRHTPDFCAAKVTPLPDGDLEICTERPLQGVAPGQFTVFYDERKHRCYGSGEIRRFS
jgi:tRNA-specific 2-thiouridylase